MAAKTRILIVEPDIDLLSKIYLTLVHKNYRAEAITKAEELGDRIKKFKPAVVVIGYDNYAASKLKIRTPLVVMAARGQLYAAPGDDIIVLETPLQLDKLAPTIEKLVV